MNLQSVELVSVLYVHLILVIVLARTAAAALFWLASEAWWGAALARRLRMLGRAVQANDAFAAMRDARADALVALAVPIVSTHGAHIAALARAARLPALFARDGAKCAPLLAYGTSFAATVRHMSGMIDRVLRGACPGEIPVAHVLQPELVVNVAVAREIGISIPSEIAARATHLIR